MKVLKKPLSTIIREYLEVSEKELNKILSNKKIRADLELHGIFHANSQGNIYIDLYDIYDLFADEDRFESIIFKIPFSQFEIYRDIIFKLIDIVTNDLNNIEENFNCGYNCNPKFSMEIVYFYKSENQLNQVMTFAEASEKWGLGESTLRSTIRSNKLEEGKDYRKSGKVWLITKDAMYREYGELKND